MTPAQRAFYDDVPAGLQLIGTVAFNGQFPQHAKPGSVVICGLNNSEHRLNAMFVFALGKSGLWHEFEPHTSHMLRLWVHQENMKTIRRKAHETPENRPWEEYK